MKKDIYVAILEFGEKKLRKGKNVCWSDLKKYLFERKKYKKFLEREAKRFFEESFKDLTGDQANEHSPYNSISSEAHSRWLSYKQFQRATVAMWCALASIIISVLFGIVSMSQKIDIVIWGQF